MMHALIAAAEPAPTSFDVGAGLAWLKGILLAAVGVVLIYITIKAYLSHGRSGDYSKATSMVVSVLICTIPLALIGGAAVLTGYGAAMLNTITGIFS